MNVTDQFSLGESVFFWVVAVIMVAAAIGVATSKKAIHSAICMVGVMLGLSMLYISQGAYFLGAVQVVVYTGAIMMMILFVIMMIGVAASDHYTKTPLGLRLGAWIAGALGAALLAGAMIVANLPATGSVNTGDASSNPVALGLSLFSQHLLSVEIVATLLIIAPTGAMLLTHSDRLNRLFRQAETAEAKMLDYAAGRRHPGQLPAPGVYADSNAPDVPALSGETMRPVEESVPRVLRATGQDRSIAEASPATAVAVRNDLHGDATQGLHSLAASRAVKQSTAWGMAGGKVERSLRQPGASSLASTQAPETKEEGE
ncbi:NADH-quinone oxidoreductase subunit J [Nanchangia anserum]|uniref:NADH-quinone oxidoreductase subunit J n=1 Tax=Nanchangia anserum TaxID=2692125 RepID=A0A8I0GBP1_9ACTO|nr:NADH-quinone oxidoreductase subunit J [Nanchangia anserum]MBD3689326.1 NADH-quinone oxidoreductase subunit J [Nanchangia anserum]QOX81538.1 NADH-quinone oxidoreductase subunit J [Nanchangia anserum]